MTKLVVEKIPLFLLSIGSAVATLIAHREGIIQIERLPITWRAANAALAFLIYIWQMIWPAKLAAVYPHPGRLPLWEPAGACAILAAITIRAFVLRKRHPYLITGWCWYLVMLLPVIGLIQVGGQGHADRYTYLPQIGLYLAATWSIADLSIALPHRREILGAAAMVIVIALARVSWIQTSYWRDSERLWRHTLALGARNDFAHRSLGKFLLQHHRLEEAISEFKTVLERHPDDADINFQLGYVFFEEREFDLAIQYNEVALKMKPGDPETETNLANALLENGRGEEAIEHYRNALRNQPSSAHLHYNLAVSLHRLGRFSEAIIHYKEALAIDRDYLDADYRLGEALLQNGQSDEAKAHLERHYDFFEKGGFGLPIPQDETASKGENPETETNLANTLLENGRGEEAVEHYRNVLRNQPSSALAHYNLAVGLHRAGNLTEAIDHYKAALQIDPNYPDADRFLGQALLQNGQPDEAKLHLEKH